MLTVRSSSQLLSTNVVKKVLTSTVEEVQGNDATVTYDKMVATVVVSVTKDGKSLDSNFSIARRY